MPWKRHGRRCDPARRKNHFNSATAVMPWKRWTRPTANSQGQVLQFGHGGDAVETSSTAGRSSPPAASRLQFGHGGDAVETLATRPLDFHEHKDFNSATAVMPWKP